MTITAPAIGRLVYDGDINVGDTVKIVGDDNEWYVWYFVAGRAAWLPEPKPASVCVTRDWWPVGGTFHSQWITVPVDDMQLVRRGHDDVVQPDPYA